MESEIFGVVKGAGFGGSLSHAFSGELQAVGVVDEAIQDRVGESGVADEVMA